VTTSSFRGGKEQGTKKKTLCRQKKSKKVSIDRKGKVVTQGMGSEPFKQAENINGVKKKTFDRKANTRKTRKSAGSDNWRYAEQGQEGVVAARKKD